jgi:hypothetical protein
MFLLFIQNISVGFYTGIQTVSNRSMLSYVIFNVPDNHTLNCTIGDTDNDGLTDWKELYLTFTSPFIEDTDNDGVSDYLEIQSGSDPNNYLDRDLLGDIDHDLDVDTDDLSFLKSIYGLSIQDDGFISDADFDSDGLITRIDYLIWRGYFNDFIGLRRVKIL